MRRVILLSTVMVEKGLSLVLLFNLSIRPPRDGMGSRIKLAT